MIKTPVGIHPLALGKAAHGGFVYSDALCDILESHGLQVSRSLEEEVLLDFHKGDRGLVEGLEAQFHLAYQCFGRTYGISDVGIGLLGLLSAQAVSQVLETRSNLKIRNIAAVQLENQSTVLAAVKENEELKNTVENQGKETPRLRGAPKKEEKDENELNELKEENEKLKEEINKMKSEQLPKDEEFNNLCDDYNNAKDENDQLKEDLEKLKQKLTECC